MRIVEDVMSRWLGLRTGARVLDVGCGTGAVLEALASGLEAYGTDTSPLAIDLCRQRGLTNAFCGTLEAVPRHGLTFDLVTLLDVVEHLDDDLGLLRQAQRSLKAGGWALVTVPAYQFLWGPHDVVNHHKRRYTRAGLRRVLRAAGFELPMPPDLNTKRFPAALVAWVGGRLARGPAAPRPPVPPPPPHNKLTTL